MVSVDPAASPNLLLYGRANSSNVQKVLWALDEMAVPFRRLDAGMEHGVVDDPAYRAMNPHGRVPLLLADGFAVWESNTIMRFLATRMASPLYPTEPGERCQVDGWMDWQLASLTADLRDVFWPLVRDPSRMADRARFDAARARLEKQFSIVDGWLSADKPFVAGNFSLADIAVGSYWHRWNSLPLERPRLPAVEAWGAKLKNRRGFRRHLMVPLS